MQALNRRGRRPATFPASPLERRYPSRKLPDIPPPAGAAATPEPRQQRWTYSCPESPRFWQGRDPAVSRLRRIALATVAGALALTGATGPAGAQAQPPPAPASEGLYIVQLAGTPVAARAGKRIDPASAEVRGYRRQLANLRESVLAKVPGAEKVYDYDTAFN